VLDKVTKANSVFPPQKIVCYGVPKIGKTTFGATFERPILLQIEDGASAIDIPATPKITSYDDEDHENTVVAALNALHGDHDYKTLVVDSLDWLEPLIWQSVCKNYNVESIEEVLKGYGKGYTEANRWWSSFMSGLDSLRVNKGMDIVLLAHSEIKKFTPPDADQYDRYQMRFKKEDLGFDKARSRGTASGNRIIHTADEDPAFNAGNRWGLPEEIIVPKGDRTDPYAPWDSFHDALETATDGKYSRKRSK
jgi:hypothetical protein